MGRIQREFREVVKSKEIAESGVQLELVNDDLTELAGTVAGPPDTPYSGGKYKLEIKIPDTYPFNPPKVRFITKIWHPNVSSDRGYLSGHLEGPVGRRHDAQDSLAQYPGPASSS